MDKWHRTAVAICCDLSSPTGGWDGSGKVGREGFFLPPPGMSLCQKNHPYRGHTVNLDLYLSVLEPQVRRSFLPALFAHVYQKRLIFTKDSHALPFFGSSPEGNKE